MELTSDNLFLFIIKKYKYRENKLKRKFKLEKNKINIKKPVISGNKEEKSKIKKYSKGLIINNSNISNFNYNSVDPFINDCFTNLEYLSITDNYIKNLDFLPKLPNLFYLDLYRNPLEDLTALNNKNIFGYLRLSVELYNEKKILNLYDLHCGILDIELRQKKYLKVFNMHNNHVCMLNNQIQYFIDIIRNAEEKIRLNNLKRKNTTKNDLSSISGHSNSNSDIMNSEVQRDSNTNALVNNVSLNLNLEAKKEYIPEKPIEAVIQKNPALLKIKQYFEDYEQEIRSKLTGENKKLYEKRRKSISLVNNEAFKSKNLEENINYLENEKEKLILIFNIYKKISLFNKERNKNTYYIGNTESIEVNQNIDDIFIKEIKDSLENNSLKIRSSIIILIAFVFYIIGIISEKMFQAIIDYIFEKHYGFDENKKAPNFWDLGNIHYLTFYYWTYDYFYKRIIDLEKTVNIEQYRDILNVLRMEKLIIRSNILYKKLKENKSKDNNLEFCFYKKNKIKKEIRSIKELKISKEFLILIQFLIDYVIYEKIEELLINKSYPGEYSYLIELKETFEETEIQVNNTKFLSSLSLSALKFERNKKERIFNKFYFEKENVKKIQNKEFKNYLVFNDLNRSNSMNNLNTSIISNNIFNNSKSNFNSNYLKIFFEDSEYNKNDDFDADEYFYIDSVKKNNTSNNSNININPRFNRRKINYRTINKYAKNEIDSSNDNSLEMEDLRLPSIQTSQNPMYEEFDFLKKMVFDPEFLSQHARYILKFEKMTKKFNKKNGINIRNHKLRNKIKFKNGELKPLHNNNILPGFVQTTYDKDINRITFNKSKMNLNLESSTYENNNQINYNSCNNNNIPFDNTNYAINSYKHLKNNRTTRNDNMKRIFDEKFRQKKYIYQNENNNELNMQFFGVPQSFPGMTLLNFGKTKSRNYSNIKLFKKKKNLSKNNVKEEKKSHKAEVISKIRETARNNFLRNARRFALSMYQ